MTSLNNKLHAAKKGKNDEFYTQISDIEKEMGHYKEHFIDKIVFCNCDDPLESNFWKYFALNFKFLSLQKLIATHYEAGVPSYKLEIIKDINGDGKVNEFVPIQSPLRGDGDFRSPECIEILEEVDIVITNPPFSLFREYVTQLDEYNKKFIIIGSQNAYTYKEIFPLIKNNKIWLGKSIHGRDREFRVPKYYPLNAARCRVDEQGHGYVRVTGIRWFTNIDYPERHEDLILFKPYNEKDYPKYDNYNAININRTRDIPMDYAGCMGVPITFLDKYNPGQFEIIGCSYSYAEPKGYHIEGNGYNVSVEKDEIYKRLFIKNKRI